MTVLQQNTKVRKIDLIMVINKLIQIFPHNTIMPTYTYYPYLFSTNINNNSFNYFPSNYPTFLPHINNNIVYQHQNIPISVSTHKITHQQQKQTPDRPLEGQNSIVLNQQQVKEAQIIQLRNRNVLPNNVSLILCFIRRIKKSGKLVQKIISRLAQNEVFTTKRFYAYQLYLKENYTDFKWKQGVQALVNYSDANCPSFSVQEQQFYNRVCRILIQQYLQQICRLQVLNHSKINRTYVQDHLKVIRYIKETLKGKFKSKMNIKYQ